MPPVYREFPETWAKDTFTSFLDMAIGNLVTTTDRDKCEYPLVAKLDNAFLEVVRALINPAAIVEAVLLMRGHASFRSTAILALGGLNPEAFVQMRSCLETALYTLHMNRNPGFDELWLRRHDDNDTLRAVRNEFLISNTFDTLKAEDATNEAVARKLYERTIDFGAHPNERAMTSSLTINDIADGKRLQQTYLSGGTLQQRHAMKSAAQIGLCALYIFRLVFREKFDILGVTAKMDEVRAVL